MITPKTPEISLILPSLNRPMRLLNALENIIDTKGDVTIEVIVLISEEDLTSQSTLESSNLLRSPLIQVHKIPTSNPAKGWNIGAKKSHGNWLFLASDDIVIPNTLLEKALSTPNFGFLAIGDGRVGRQNWEPFFMATREWLKLNQGGVFIVPHYQHWGMDLEVCARAALRGHYRRAEIPVEHNHPLFGTARKDSTYKRAEKYYQVDLDLFHVRQSQGFPNDFEGYLE